MTAVSIVFLADTHGLHEQVVVPEADILVHAGDVSMHGELEDIERFSAWLATLPHRHKIVIAGNHDFCFQRQPEKARSRLQGCTYLQDAGAEIEGLRIWGSPWQPWFYDWAFNLQRGNEIARQWALIPDNTDVLVTHGPPRGYGDGTVTGLSVGCDDLLRRIGEIRPAVHAFGHIHEGYGASQEADTLFVNASVCTFGYEPVNPPVLMYVENGTVVLK